MKVSKSRWGEVTIKKQGKSKNVFDATKSFSIDPSETEYSIDNYYEILQIVTDLTEKAPFKELKSRLSKL